MRVRDFHFNVHLCEIIATEIFMYSEREKELYFFSVFVSVCESE
jgi:hypothetical protein